MTSREEYCALAFDLIKRSAKSKEPEPLKDAFCVLQELERYRVVVLDGKTILDEPCRKAAHLYTGRIRTLSARLAKKTGDSDMVDLYRNALKFDAPYDLDCAIRYAEWNRPKTKKFYEPRRKQLKRVVDAMQKLEERKIRMLGVMAPPGTGKSTVAIMFMVWSGCRHPELSILGGSHSNSFLRGVYDEINRMLDPDGEYLWADIFPDVFVANTNAKDMRIDLCKSKRFETFEFSSIGSGNAGKVRASNLLYADDLVDGLESAMSRDRMDKLCSLYNTDMRQRMIGDCVELLIQTPWTPHDPIDVLEAEHENDPQASFIHLPALDENDESNFDYPYGVGFTTKFFHDQRELLDDATWNGLYMTHPREREGQLYAPDELRRFRELPAEEPDAIYSVVDVADGGGDYWVMPVAYQYGTDFYIYRILCDNGKPDIVEERIYNLLMSERVKIARFESNRGGGVVAENVKKKVKAANGITDISTKWNQTNKETRIRVVSGYIKQHFLFLEDDKQDREYKSAMRMLTQYTLAGKNKHDDVPDAMSMLADLVSGKNATSIKIVKRTF